ncbi:MAG: septum formation initiator family protein [Parvularculaceae bacterium]
MPLFKFLFDVAFPALVVCLIAILSYSAVASDTGYRALAELRREAEVKEQVLDELRARRIDLEKQADLLNSKSLDPDYLDERARAVLGYSREGDVVISRRELDRLLSRGER